jgi:hypothetical protein
MPLRLSQPPIKQSRMLQLLRPRLLLRRPPQMPGSLALLSSLKVISWQEPAREHTPFYLLAPMTICSLLIARQGLA